MPNTYSAMYAHLIFATKGRVPMIEAAWKPRLHAYMAGTLRGLETNPEIVGGITDHVHILVQIKPATNLPSVVRELKKASTFWVQRECYRADFAWQVGYAALTVSPFDRRDLIRYIANQEEHHSSENSRDELLRLLRAADVEVDMKYFE